MCIGVKLTCDQHLNKRAESNVAQRHEAASSLCNLFRNAPERKAEAKLRHEAALLMSALVSGKIYRKPVSLGMKPWFPFNQF